MKSFAARPFIVAFWLCVFSLVAMNAGAQSQGAWPPQAGQYRFHMIGNAHIDAPWLWPWPEAMSVALSTFRSALDRMNENPGFHFHRQLRTIL